MICVWASQFSRSPFLKGDGFDLYIDRACGLPFPCTVSKVVVRVIGDVGDEVRWTNGVRRYFAAL